MIYYTKTLFDCGPKLTAVQCQIKPKTDSSLNMKKLLFTFLFLIFGTTWGDAYRDGKVEDYQKSSLMEWY
jgi:hypothetical protein